MKNKGFTLVELLAAILLLALIAFLVVPNVAKTLNESKEKVYVEQIDRIENAAKQYTKTLDGTSKIKDPGDCSVVTIDEMVRAGLLKAEEKNNSNKYIIIDPRTNEEMLGHISIRYNYSGNQYSYSYEENNTCQNQSTLYNSIDISTITVGNSICKDGDNSDSMTVTRVSESEYKYEYSSNSSCSS